MANVQTGREFAGKVVVVTGASAGIGRAAAAAFAAAGAKVAVAGRHGEAASRAAGEIARNSGATTLAVQTDISDPAQCDRLIETAIARLGGVDILVNNAAFFALVPLIEATVSDAENFLSTNLLGPLFCGQALARWAIKQGRRAVIVNVGSISGARPALGCGLYSASKAALESLTKSMALEWGPKGVRVNGVAPGHVSTDGVKADFAAGRLDFEAMVKKIPAGRIASVEDIAETVLFLASDRARHVVGATLTVDGGEGM
jgi:NAD(P)-dependent dehydrogenase (short-subunit alcohol dehydrogenase family)